jgi:hypothetical protein
MAPYEFIIFKLDLLGLNANTKRRVRLLELRRGHSGWRCDSQAIYNQTYLLDVLVDILHALLAAFLSGGALEALLHLGSLLGDTDFVRLNLDFVHLFVSKKEHVTNQNQSM